MSWWYRFIFLSLIPGLTVAATIYGNTATSSRTLTSSQFAAVLSELQLGAGKVEKFYATVNEGACPIRFQIWRPAGGDDYTLVGEVQYTAQTSGDVEVVPTEDIIVEATDKLGFAVTEPNKACIVYDAEFPNILKGYSISSGNPPVLGQTYAFSTINIDAKLALRVEIGQATASHSTTSLTQASTATTVVTTSLTQTVTTGSSVEQTDTSSIGASSSQSPISSEESTSSPITASAFTTSVSTLVSSALASTTTTASATSAATTGTSSETSGTTQPATIVTTRVSPSVSSIAKIGVNKTAMTSSEEASTSSVPISSRSFAQIRTERSLPNCTASSTLISDVFGSNTSSTTLQENGEAAIILVYLELTYGKVIRFFGNFVAANCSIRFQIWRPDGSTKYRLIGETNYTSVGAGYYTILPTEDIDVEPQDRLGFSATGFGESCIPYELDPLDFTRLTWQYEFGAQGPPSHNVSHTFYILDVTRLFGIQVEIGNYVNETVTCHTESDTTLPSPSSLVQTPTQDSTSSSTDLTSSTETAVTTGCPDTTELVSDVFGSNTSSTTILEKSGAAIILVYLKLTYGKVIRFFANFVEAGCPVGFQIWRPDAGVKYKLVGQTSYTSVGAGYYTIYPTEDIDVEPQDRLGFSFTKSCIPYELDPLNFTRVTWQFEFTNQMPPTANESRAFYILDITRLFGVQVEIGNYINQPGECTTVPPPTTPELTTTPTEVVTECIDTPRTESGIFGESISDTSVLEKGEAVIILVYLELAYGKVFNFFANFVSADCHVRFQIWRPDGSKYKLIGETLYTSVGAGYYTVPPTYEIDVEPQDRLGFTFTHAIDSCIPYELNALNFTRLTRQYEFLGQSPPAVGESHAFYILDITRLFGIQVEIGNRFNDTTCSDVTTTTEPITEPSTSEVTTVPTTPCVTESTSLQSDVFGSNTSSTRTLETSDASVILVYLKLAYGKVIRFFANFVSAGCPVRLQIWRPDGKRYKLIGETNYTTVGVGYYTITPTEDIDVEPDDRLGFTFTDVVRSCIPFELDPVNFTRLTWQYEFERSAIPTINGSYQFYILDITRLFGIQVEIGRYVTETRPCGQATATTASSTGLQPPPLPPTDQPTLTPSTEKLTLTPSLPDSLTTENFGFNTTSAFVFKDSEVSVILEDVQLAKGKLVRFHVFLTRASGPIKAQIWKPEGGSDYSLYTEESFTSPSDGYFEIPSSTYVDIEADYKLGFTLTNQAKDSIIYEFTEVLSNLSKTIHYSFSGKSEPALNERISFSYLAFTKLFAISADIATEEAPPTQEPPRPTIPTMTISDVYGHNDTGDKQFSHTDLIVVLEDVRLAEGKVIKFYAILENSLCTIVLQIWRPVDVNTDLYYLVGEETLTSTSSGLHWVEPSTVIRVQPVDKLGFTLTSTHQGCLNYTFTDDRNALEKTIHNTFTGNPSPQTEQNYTFNFLAYTKIFPVMVEIGEVIPMNLTKETTADSPSPIAVTEIVNKELYGFNSSAQNALPIGMRTIILKDAVLADGFLSNFFVRVVEPNCSIGMQIWQHLTGDNYSLYINADFESPKAGYFEVPLSTPMAVNSTDRLGFTIYSNFSGCVAYDEVVTRNQESETIYSDFVNDKFPLVNEEKSFQHLSRNYLFSIFAAIGDKVTTTTVPPPPPPSSQERSFSLPQTTTVSYDPTREGPVGPRGNQGSKGDIGVRGPSGLTGDTGDRGSNGLRGTSGTEGVMGLTGPNGNTGLPGERGPSGNNGSIGPIGETGLTGKYGPKGNNGSTGDQGDIGPTGIEGPRGITGQPGRIGMTGLTGAQGERGVAGINGSIGWTGIQGNTGPTGVAGPLGWTGLAGDIGEKGPSGAIGATWKPYDYCKNNNGGCQNTCTSGDFGPICSCDDGYESPDGVNCIDVDECKTKNGRCQFICSNSIGNYECSCPNGYTLSKDKHRCNDIDECALKTDNCKAGYICINQYAGFFCLGPNYKLQSESTSLENVQSPQGPFAAAQYDVYFVTENVLIGLLIWLIVLSVLLAIAILLAIPMISDCCDDKKDEQIDGKPQKDFFYPSFFPRVSLSGVEYGGNEVTVERQL